MNNGSLANLVPIGEKKALNTASNLAPASDFVEQQIRRIAKKSKKISSFSNELLYFFSKLCGLS